MRGCSTSIARRSTSSHVDQDGGHPNGLGALSHVPAFSSMPPAMAEVRTINDNCLSDARHFF
jgi:hypothetical protein